MALPQKRSARNIIILMETIKALYISTDPDCAIRSLLPQG
jgi:hypothetical protein